MSLSSANSKPPSISNFPLNPPITWNRRWNLFLLFFFVTKAFRFILFFYWYHSYAKLWSNKQELSEQAVEQIYFILISYASNKSSSSSSFFSLLLSNQTHNSPTKNNNNNKKNLTHYIIEQCIYIVCIYLFCEITAQAPLQFPRAFIVLDCCLLSKCYLTNKVNYPRSQNLLIFL